MTRNERNRTGAALLCAALLAGLPFLVACGGEREAEPEIQMVQVQINDDQLEMPSSLPTGATRFEISNAGSHDHSFGITGPAGEQKLEKPLKPGETAALELFLDTGTYRVYCPVDESHGHSMQMALNVTPEAAGGKG